MRVEREESKHLQIRFEPFILRREDTLSCFGDNSVAGRESASREER